MNTKALRQKILDLAIHGKLVPQDPNDEPASVLLQRIKAEKERLIKEGKIKRAKKSKATCDQPHYENVPFEVPSSWVWTTLGEICIFLSRGKSPKYKDDDRTYPVFAQKCNLKEGGISLEQARFIDPNTIDKWAEEYKLKTGDILINSTGTGTVGRTRLFNESCLGDYPFVVPDSHVSVVRTYDEILSEFIYAYISSNFVQQYLEENLAGSTNQKELYISVLDNLNIPLPPYKEQKRIADEIERWSRQTYRIDINRDNLTHTIKQVKNKVLDLAIHGKLVPQDPTDEPASELLKRINPKAEITCDNGQYGKLPKGWCLCNLSSLCKIKGGKRIPRGRTFSKGRTSHIYIRVSDMKNNTIMTTDLKYIDDDVYQTIKNYTISSTDLYLTIAGTIGHVGIVPKQFDGMNLTENAAKLTSIICDKKYLLYSLLSSTAQEHFKSRFHQVAQPKLSIETASSTIVCLPPLNEQHRIVAKIEEIFTQLDNIAAAL